MGWGWVNKEDNWHVIDLHGDHIHTCRQHTGSTKDAHETILDALQTICHEAGLITQRRDIPSVRKASGSNPEGGHGLPDTMFDHVARGGLQAAGSAGGDDHAEIATLGASRARSHSPCAAAIPTMQEAAVPSSRPVRGEPALGGGLGMGTSGRQDGGHTLALDSVQDMPVAVLGSCHALGGGGGSDSGRAEAGSVVVGVVVADGGCGGPGRAADEGVDRVVQGQPEAVLDARGASGGGVQGSADAAASPLANRPLSQRERRRQIRKRNVAKRQASSRPAP